MTVKELTQVRKPLLFARDSHSGRLRENNEDLCYIDPERGAFIVIDGVGGHAAGELAAKIALEEITARLEDPNGPTERRIYEAITLANNEIYERAQESPELLGMACVITLAIVEEDKVTIGHVGDTRLYKMYDGQIKKITHDHSPVGEQEDDGSISELDAMRHPRRNEIYRDVGSEWHENVDDEGFIDIFRERFEPDCALLLCSDGLTDMLTSEDIFQIVRREAGSPDAVVRELIAAANEAGGKDNITVVYVEGGSFSEAVRKWGAERNQPKELPQAYLSDEGATKVKEQSYALAAKKPRAEDRTKPPLTYFSPEPVGSRRILNALSSRPAVFVYGALLTVVLFNLAQIYLRRGPAEGPDPSQPKVLQVDRNNPSALITINRAMEKARAGDTVEVAPGEYAEQIHLKEGVSLISQKPRQAVITLPDQPPGVDIAVIADNLKSGRFVGFRIEGNEKRPLLVGLRLMNSNIEVADVEIKNTQVAAIEIGGAESALLQASDITENVGAGIVVSGKATPRLSHNMIKDNGKRGVKKRSGIEILDSARPELVGNLIFGNGIQRISGLSNEDMDEVMKRNFFSPGGNFRERRAE